MDFDYTESEQSFRQEVQDFLRENLPPKKDRDENFPKLGLKRSERKVGWAFHGQKRSEDPMAD